MPRLPGQPSGLRERDQNPPVFRRREDQMSFLHASSLVYIHSQGMDLNARSQAVQSLSYQVPGRFGIDDNVSDPRPIGVYALNFNSNTAFCGIFFLVVEIKTGSSLEGVVGL